MSSKIWLSSPHMGGGEMKYVQEAYDTNWVAPLGKNVNMFEDQLTEYTRASYASALSSGTSAIHLALVLLGVGQGDEVIVQSFTFSASANPVTYVGAIPVFVDSEEDTWNMCPEALKKAIEDRIAKGKVPKAIIPVHLYGMPAKMDEIMKVANEFNIPVIEDAAEALGSSYKNKKMGTWGYLGVLSFNGNKIITTSGGGALLSYDKELIDKSRFLATQARDVAPHYEHSHIGFNYRMSNILAGIGCGQMEVLDSHIEKRRDNNSWYKKLLENNEGVTFQEEPDERYYSNFWLTSICIDPKKCGISREELRLKFEEGNIESRPLWKPMHLQPVFKDFPFYSTGVSEKLFINGLCLPSGSNMTREERDRIAGVLHETLIS